MIENNQTTEEVEELEYDDLLEEFYESKKSMSRCKRIYNISVLALSSISFGYGLTSMETFSSVVNSSNKEMDYEESTLEILKIFATSNIFLGGLISNILIRLFPSISRKHLLILAAMINSAAYSVQYFFPVIVAVSICRICIGLSSGIVCAIVPNFLHDYSTKTLEGFIPGIHSVGICIGIVLGYGFGIYDSSDLYHIPMFIIIAYSLVNAFLLKFITKIKNEGSRVKEVGVFPLLRMKEARKSLLTSCIFHLSQHLSGVDFVSLFSKKFIGHEVHFYAIILSSLSLAIPCTFISCLLLEKLGRKPIMIISCSLLCIVTLLFGLTNYHKILIYSFVLSYNIGVATIPWIITNEIFSKECFKSGNMIGVTVNWLSAYILAISSASIFEVFGEIVWYCFSASMFLVNLYTVFYLKETKEATVPQFQ